MNDKINKLIGRHLSGNTNPAEDQWLNEWISKSSANKSEFEKTRRIWETSFALKKDREVDVNAAWAEFRTLAEKPLVLERRSVVTPLRIAAGLALIACIGIITWLVVPPAIDDNDISELKTITSPVPTETTVVTDTLLEEESQLIDSILNLIPKTVTIKRRKVVKNVVLITIATNDSAKAFLLPDNSIVFLNDHSTLKYEETFGKNNRKLSLTGEAYFEPVKDTMQLMVSCGKTVTRGMDAFFNVREDKVKSEVEVIVVSGTAEFSGVGKKEYKKLVLTAGNRAVCNKDEVISMYKTATNDYKWWQKKNLRAKFKRLFEKIRNTFR